MSLEVLIILCNSKMDKRLNMLAEVEDSFRYIRFANKICLTFSHDSVGCSSRLNRTSAKAGCFSAAVQLKLRLFLNQDMLIFFGDSYLTVEDIYEL